MLTIRSLAICLLATAALCHAVTPATSAETGKSLSGEIVDLACYVGHGAKGPDHQKCAQKCAQMGQPMGLLKADGNLYLLVADHVNPDPYRKARSLAGEQVEILGEVSEKGGMKALTVDEVKKK
ncbi:MAG: hypothetical protein L0191_20360 [Acidobacteria bacterium]|nr:hypothetical protein [Acidobacteriota bacterium]